MLREDRSALSFPEDPIEEIHGGSLHPRLAWMLYYKETRSAQEVCEHFGISRKTFYKWLKRYKKTNGDAKSLTDRSRRPHRFPRATPESSVQLLKKLKEQTGFGQRRLKVHLQKNYNINISERTIWKILKRMGNSDEPSHTNSPSDRSSIFTGGL